MRIKTSTECVGADLVQKGAKDARKRTRCLRFPSLHRQTLNLTQLNKTTLLKRSLSVYLARKQENELFTNKLANKPSGFRNPLHRHQLSVSVSID